MAIIAGAAWKFDLPASLADSSGAYRFLRFQADGITPVTYDPCRRIHYVIRQKGAPPGGNELITNAVLRVSRATGLQFAYDGTTTEDPSSQRPAQQPNRYQSRWAPVLIAWVTPDEDPQLAGDVTGTGGSASVGLPNQPQAYVTGTVRLDAEQMAGILKRGNGQSTARGIVLHELGHLVGLDHVDAASQLMYPKARPGVTDFGDGDLNGLAKLGKGRCQPQL